MEVSPLIVNIVRYTARLIAALAVHRKRARLSHIEPQLFLELHENLRRTHLSESVIAEMFGLSGQTAFNRRQTYERDYQASIAPSSAAPRAWFRIVRFLRQQRDWCRTKDIVASIEREDVSLRSAFGGTLIRGILAELEALGWAEGRGGERSRDYRWRGGDEVFRQSTLALVRQHIFSLGPATQDAIAQVFALGQEEVTSVLDELLKAGHITRGLTDRGCEVYDCNGLDLGPPMIQSIDAAFLDHFQAMTWALTDRLTGNVNQELPPVGGSTFTLELWSGHPFEARARETFERCRRDLSQLRQEMQAMKSLLRGAGQEPDRSERYTLKIYIGQHVLASHNRSHLQGGFSDAIARSYTSPPKPTDASS